MTKINFEDLEDEFGTLPTKGKIAKGQSPVGSLTDNRRIAEPNRNGAYKRAARAKEWGKNHGTL